jgi:hypothetical protein
MNPKSSKKSKPFIVEEIDDDDNTTTSKVQTNKKDEKQVQQKNSKQEITHHEEKHSSEIVEDDGDHIKTQTIHEHTVTHEEHHDNNLGKSEVEATETITESVKFEVEKQDIIDSHIEAINTEVQTSQVKQTIEITTTDQVIVEEQIESHNVEAKEEIVIEGSQIAESIEINNERSKVVHEREIVDNANDSIPNIEQEEDIKVESEALTEEELKRQEEIEELKALALVRTREATEKKLEANKLNINKDIITDEYLDNLKKSLEIYSEGVRLIEPVLNDFTRYGLRNDKAYQNLLTEKRNLYSNIALAHQRLKNFDEALRYNNLVILI